jgi:SOS-response transcriptional repressor LexA
MTDGQELFVHLERRHNLWHPFLALGKKYVEQSAWDKATASFAQVLLIVEDLMTTAEDRQANQLKGATLFCIGAQALCQNNHIRARQHFRHSEDSFRRGRDNYGCALALWAIGITHELEKEWNQVFPVYDRAQKKLEAQTEPEARNLKEMIHKRSASAMKKWRHDIGDDAEIDSPLSLPSTVFLEFLPIFGRIPAGNPYPVLNEVTAYVETDRLLIDGVSYFIWNHAQPRLRLNFSVEVTYLVMRVNGDSMNQAGINDGDYVLLRTMARAWLMQPEDGDIVAAAVSEERVVTLKRFRRHGKQISLEPESSNPQHQAFTFESVSGFGSHVEIKGILVGILKPVPAV